VGPQSAPILLERFYFIMAQTKNILFDLGGVLLDIDYQRSVDAFEKLGIEHFEKMFSQYHASELFEKLERGEVSKGDFYAAISKRIKPGVTEEEIEAACNALILDFRIKSLEFLEELAADYKLYLLSNTNSIHVAFFKRLFTTQTGRPSLDDYFTKAWYSNDIGMRKPGPEIFEFILQDGDLKAAETLFIDDTLDNIKTAQKLGFKTHHLLPNERIELLDISSL
jgi:putative hydrolase of the HAD superfamily